MPGALRISSTSGVAAMNVATNEFATQTTNTGVGHFFIAPIVEAIPLYAPSVPASTVATWKSRMSTAVPQTGPANNQRTYWMKGQLERAQAGLISMSTAVSDIETNWINNQKARIDRTR